MKHLTMLAALAASLACVGCSDDPTDTPTGAGGTGGAGPQPGCDQSLEAGATQEAVQTALIEVADDKTICFGAGTFAFDLELSLSQGGVTLRGAGLDQTVFDFTGQSAGANGLALTGDRVTVEKLTVKNTKGDGIRASDVTDITFREVAVRWDAEASVENGAYGLYPVGSDGVRIEKCLVHGARDAGIYVGQSTKILVAESEAYGNVAGIEIENSTDAEVVNNHVHDNTGGVLVFNLPDLPVQDGKRAKIHSNVIERNNLPSFAEEGTVVSNIPPGVGVILLASDGNEIHDNQIRDNNSSALVVLHYTEVLFDPTMDPNFDPYPQGNFVHDNTFENNGTDPHLLVGSLTDIRPVPDIMDDGCLDPDVTPSAELVNCISNNGTATYLDFDLCMMGGPSSDPAPVTCEHPSLPAQDP